VLLVLLSHYYSAPGGLPGTPDPDSGYLFSSLLSACYCLLLSASLLLSDYIRPGLINRFRWNDILGNGLIKETGLISGGVL
jgi:hypothetical protein